MSEQDLIQHAAPTLAGIKTANLFSVSCPDRARLLGQLRAFNTDARSKGLRCVPLLFKEKRALLYLYRAYQLAEDLENRSVRAILTDAGYTHISVSACLARLCARLRAQNGTFPHEIGCFLGYPPADVEGFMVHKAQAFLLTGYWKVYGDVEKAKARFAAYDSCHARYLERWRSGARLPDLMV